MFAMHGIHAEVFALRAPLQSRQAPSPAARPASPRAAPSPAPPARRARCGWAAAPSHPRGLAHSPPADDAQFRSVVVEHVYFRVLQQAQPGQ